MAENHGNKSISGLKKKTLNDWIKKICMHNIRSGLNKTCRDANPSTFWLETPNGRIVD